MSRAQITAVYRALFALLTLVAIGAQMGTLAGQGVLNPVNYFSYFTIDSNLIAVSVLLVSAAWWNEAVSPRLDLVRGAAVVYMSVTGIVFTLLLSNTDVDTAIPWVYTVVHELMPLVMVADWLLVAILVAMLAVIGLTVVLANAAGGGRRRLEAT